MTLNQKNELPKAKEMQFNFAMIDLECEVKKLTLLVESLSEKVDSLEASVTLKMDNENGK